MATDIQIKQMLADANIALSNEEYEEALKLAIEARKIEPNNPETHRYVSLAYFGMGKLDEAIASALISVKYDDRNGNRYAELGYAYARKGKTMDAFRTLTRAIELGCERANLIRIYHLLSVICFELRRFDDVLVNIEKVEELMGQPNLDLMRRKAAAYAAKEDIRNAFLAANELKVFSPSEYRGYQVVIRILTQLKKYDAVREEFEKASKYSKGGVEIIFDKAAFEMDLYRDDNNQEHLEEGLKILDSMLRTSKLTATEVLQAYVSAAEFFNQSNRPNDVIHCLDATANPARAYNSGFELLEIIEEDELPDLADIDLDELRENEMQKAIEKYGEYGLQEMAEGSEPDENGILSVFTEFPEEFEVPKQEKYVLDEEEKVVIPSVVEQQIVRLYLEAYSKLEDYDNVITYAKKLQGKDNLVSDHIGRYYEACAKRKRGDADAVEGLRSLLAHYRSCVIKDPSDVMAHTYRIQCHVELGEYDEAEKLTMVLSSKVRQPLLDLINKARQGGV